MCCAVVGAEKKKRTPALLLFLRKGFCYKVVHVLAVEK
jgi:hypothetical protein